VVHQTEAERRAREGVQSSVKVLAKATSRSPAALYRAIHREEIKAIWVGRTPMVPPGETLRLLGLET
jgi:hypothetical protein